MVVPHSLSICAGEPFSDTVHLCYSAGAEINDELRYACVVGSWFHFGVGGVNLGLAQFPRILSSHTVDLS